jgi:hypothetical protein
MLHPDPDRRYSIQEILDSPWMRTDDFPTDEEKNKEGRRILMAFSRSYI